MNQYFLIKNNIDIIVISNDANRLFGFRNSLSWAEKMQYCVVIKRDGYYLKITEDDHNV